jgi:hypothetical protein
MPRMLLFGRATSLSSDDFVYSSFWSLLTRLTWIAASIVWLLGDVNVFVNCGSSALIQLTFASIALAAFGGFFDALLCIQSSRGSLSRDAPRKSVPRIVEIRIVIIILDVCLAGVLAAAAAGTIGNINHNCTTFGDTRTSLFSVSVAVTLLAGMSSLAHFLTWGCAGLCRSRAVALIELRSRLAALPINNAVTAQEHLNHAFAPAAQVWATVMRTIGVFLCPLLRKEAGESHAAALTIVSVDRDSNFFVNIDSDLKPIVLRLRDASKVGAAKDYAESTTTTPILTTANNDTYAHAGIVAAAIFEPCVALSWTPSDVIASIIMLAAEQEQTRNKQNNNNSPSASNTSTSTTTTSTTSLDRDNNLISAIIAADAVAPYALAAYASPILCLERGPLIGTVTLLAASIGFAMNDVTFASCAPGSIDSAPRSTLCHGLPLFDCDRIAARSYLWRIKGPTVLLASGHPSLAPWTPWLATRRISDNALIISLRGTLSGENALFDILTLPLPLSQAVGGVDALLALTEMGGPVLNPTETAVHEGMWFIASGIAASLHAHGLLTPPPPRLILVGHSLGAGVVSLLALQLLKSSPIIECIALAPPPALMSPALATSLKPFVTSIILGDDIVSKLSSRAAARTAHAVVSAGLSSGSSKASIFARATLGMPQTLQNAPINSTDAAAVALKKANSAVEIAETIEYEQGTISHHLSAGRTALGPRMAMAGQIVHLKRAREGYESLSCGTRAFTKTAPLLCLCCSGAARDARTSPQWAAASDCDGEAVIGLSHGAALDHLPHYYAAALSEAVKKYAQK